MSLARSHAMEVKYIMKDTSARDCKDLQQQQGFCDTTAALQDGV